MKKRDWSKLSAEAAPSNLTPEERQAEEQNLKEYEAGYQRFVATSAAYDAVIELEDCPDRKQRLKELQAQLHEDNK